ncbi:MAG: hypothetical protein KDA31_11540 [Phycisphaerales bacterium]|nr:hypothetical protein [Phycisphaerales bacterium]MCB9836162.1 hypothetical protein [Phycisphaera sp.]
MNKLASIAAVALLASAGSASADIGFHVGLGSSFGFCGSGIGFSTGISIGSSWGCYRPAYSYWDGCGTSWGGYTGWYTPSWHHSGYRHYTPRRYHRGHWRGHDRYRHSDRGWCEVDLGELLPAAVTVASTHDRPVNRTPVVTDTVAVDDRLAQAWELLEKGEANRAQGFFALAASKAPDDAVAKIGFALACAEMDDTSRAEWSARRALAVDAGELATLTLGDQASIVLADLLDTWQADGLELAADLGAAMPGVVTLPTDEVAVVEPEADES